MILASQPFEVLMPKVELKAPATARAGGTLAFEVSGELSTFMTVTLVPADAPNAHKSRLRFQFHEGQTSAASSFSDLPEPGEYELRCVSYYQAGVIYARTPVTIE